MSFRYARHWTRIYNRPLLIEPGAFQAMLPGIERVFRAGVLPEKEALVSVSTKRSDSTGLRMFGSVAVVPIMGPLVHRGSYDAECNYLLGYQDVARMLRAAGEDPAVKAVVLNMDSPGGEVSGCFDLAERLEEMTQGKPIYTAVNDRCCSAAYAIAAATSHIASTKTGESGSIGVYMQHADMSEYLKKAGLNITLVHAGKHKVDGNPFEPLSADVLATLQAEVDQLYGVFVAHVAAHRGMSDEAVRATEARVFHAEEAINLGLVDSIESPDHLITRVADAMVESRAISTAFVKTQKEDSMLTETVAAALGVQPDATEGAILNAIKQVRADGIAAEFDRILGILTCPQAEGRLETAVNLARVEAMTPESAGAVLETIKPASAGPANEFAATMNALNPSVDSGESQGDGDDALKQARNGWARAFGIGLNS